VSNRVRIALLVLGAAIFVAGAYASQGPPRLTLLNAGLSVQHPWRHPAGAVIAAAGATLLAAASPRRWSRLIFHALAGLSVLVAIHLALYRVDADQSGLASHGLLGRTRIAWGEVADMQEHACHGGLLEVRARDGRRVQLRRQQLGAAAYAELRPWLGALVRPAAAHTPVVRA